MQTCRYRPLQRVRTAEDHRAVWRGGRRRYVGPLVVIVAERQDQPVARLGTAISKKAIRRAVGRNRVKRIMRESFRQVASTLPPVDIVFSLSRKQPLRDDEQLRKALEDVWRLLKKSS